MALGSSVFHKVKQIEEFEWKHKNLLFLVIGILTSYYLLAEQELAGLIEVWGNFGYPAAFLFGLLYSYGATTPIAIVAFYLLAGSVHPLAVATVGSMGAVISNFIIFRFVKSNIVPELILVRDELKPRIRHLAEEARHVLHFHAYSFNGGLSLRNRPAQAFKVRVHALHFKPGVLHKLAPFIAGIIMASPLPDEIAASLLGAVHYETKRFLAYSFTIKFASILTLSYMGSRAGLL